MSIFCIWLFSVLCFVFSVWCLVFGILKCRYRISYFIGRTKHKIQNTKYVMNSTFYEFITISLKIQEISSVNRPKAKYLIASNHPTIRKGLQNNPVIFKILITKARKNENRKK